MLRKRNYTKPTRCPLVNYIHEEMSCLDANLMMQLPARGQRGAIPFAFLTTIRDPIERIGSQAFYGSKSIGHVIIKDMLRTSNVTECDRYKNMSSAAMQQVNPTAISSSCRNDKHAITNPICICFTDTMARAMANIRINETAWFNWIHNVVGFSDEYMSNYFIKRLVRRTDKSTRIALKLEENFRKASLCVHSTQGCMVEDTYTILRGILPTTTCMSPFDYLRLNYNVTDALNLAKQVLQHHLDFIILDHFDEPRSLRILQDALHNDLRASKSFMQSKDNGGVRATPIISFGKGKIDSIRSESKDRGSSSKVSGPVKKMNVTKGIVKKLVLVTTDNRKTHHNNTVSNAIGSKKVEKNNKKANYRERRRLLSQSNNNSSSNDKDSRKGSNGARYSYRSDMPPSIVQFLEKDNAEDIEFYRFAVQEFERRTKQEQLQR